MMHSLKSMVIIRLNFSNEKKKTCSECNVVVAGCCYCCE